MKKFFTVALLVLSMLFFVACGDDDDDINTQGLGGGNGTSTGTDENNDDDKGDSGKTDTGDTGDKTGDETGDNADSTDDTDTTGNDDTGTDDADTTGDGDETDSGNDEPIDDSKCETMVYKSKDLLVYDVNEIEMWFYDTETFDDYTDPLFFIDAFFSKNIADIKGEAVSLEGSDANKEGSNRFFLYKKPQTAEEEDYLAKSGSITVEDIDGNGKAKISTTAIVFYQIAIDDGEDYRWVEVENGKCYKLEAFEWNSITEE